MEALTVDSNGSVKVMSYGRIKKESGAWHNGRSISRNLLIYVVSGYVKMQVSNQTLQCETGDIICIPANTFYNPLDAKKLEYYFIHFTAKTDISNERNLQFGSNTLLPEGDFEYTFLGGSSVSSINLVTHCRDNENVKDIFLKIASLNIRSDGEKLLLDCFVRELLIYMSENFGIGNTVSAVTARVADYIDRNFREDITLGSLSEMVGISKSYIARMLKRELKVTSTEYLHRVRTANACRLLLNTDKSISQISEEVGFKEQYYFTRVFKRIYSTTPTEYKKRNILL